MMIRAMRLTPALTHRSGLIVNFYLRMYPMADFPNPMRGGRVIGKIRFVRVPA